MTLPYFSRIFDALINAGNIIRKPGPEPVPFHPNPPSMFVGKAKEEWEESQKKSKEDWEKRREEKEIKTDLSREKPRETKRKGKNVIITPEGRELQYDFVTKNAQGIVTYFKDQKKQYSYLGESFLSLSEYKKIKS